MQECNFSQTRERRVLDFFFQIPSSRLKVFIFLCIFSVLGVDCGICGFKSAVLRIWGCIICRYKIKSLDLFDIWSRKFLEKVFILFEFSSILVHLEFWWLYCFRFCRSFLRLKLLRIKRAGNFDGYISLIYKFKNHGRF